MQIHRAYWVGLAAALLLVAGGAPRAWAVDFTEVAIFHEDDGFPGVCAAPCFSVEKVLNFYDAGSTNDPGYCAATEDTYVYTLTHIGGTLPFPSIPVTEFEASMDDALVALAGWDGALLPPPPGPPGTVDVDPLSVTVSPQDIVNWGFPGTPSCPNCLNQFQTSAPLWVCCDAATTDPVTVPANMSVTAIILDAPGENFVCGAAECQLDIDKTCCMPPPPIPPGDICEGKSVRAVFELVDGDCEDTTNLQGGEAKCFGDNPFLNPAVDTVSVDFRKDKDDLEMDIIPDTGLAVGDTFEITSVADPTLKNQLKLLVTGPGGTQNIEIHVSCSAALRCNDQFGVLKLVELETTLGGTVVCDLPPGPQTETNCVAGGNDGGTPCDSKLTEATFRFTPSACQNPLPNPQGGAAKCEGDASDADDPPFSVTYTGQFAAKISVIPASGIEDGDTFQVVPTGRDSLHSKLPLLIADGNSIEQAIEIHTSCSQPLACGDVFGSLTLVGFKTKDGLDVNCDPPTGPVFADSCECPLGPPTPHCTDRLEELQLAYLGDLLPAGDPGCEDDVSNPQNGQGTCTGDHLSDDGTGITILTDPTNISAEPAIVDVTGVFSIQKEVNGWVKDLPNEIQFEATDGVGTQTVTIHTSCSEPLNLGDRFGNFVVFGMDRGDGDNSADSDSDSDSDGEDGLIQLGCVVEYQYAVTHPVPPNPNENVIDLLVYDDPHGTIVTGETLVPNETKTFFKTVTLYESLTDTGMVTGELEVSHGECSADPDQVDVTVTLPPPGAFDCNGARPIDELSMEWAGTEMVCVVAHDGDPSKPVLKTQPNVTPGSVVTVSGMGGSPNDQVWEIYGAGGCGGTLLGTSEFHISCSDGDMNGVEDCGKNQGDGKSNDPGLINDWLLDAITGTNGGLDCSPAVIPPGSGGGSCGVGAELALLLPGLAWLYRRRRLS
jgi:hypothetical protein